MDQLAPPLVAKHADHAEVDKCDAVAGQIKKVAGVWVSVEKTIHYNHFYHRRNAAAGKNLAVETRTIDSGKVPAGDALDIFLHTDALARPLPIDFGDHNDWRQRMLLARRRGPCVW